MMSSGGVEVRGDDPRVVCVALRETTINFCYKDERGDTQTIRGIGPIPIPDYEKDLLELAEKRDDLSKNPIYSHMTRLWEIAPKKAAAEAEFV